MVFTPAPPISPYKLTKSRLPRTIFTYGFSIIAAASVVTSPVAAFAKAEQTVEQAEVKTLPFTGPPAAPHRSTDARLLAVAKATPAEASGKPQETDKPEQRQKAAGPVKCGNASWYAYGSHTASGERFSSNALTAAHRSMPFGTRLEVTNMKTNRTVVVRVNDRGPFVHGRLIDLSKGAARQIGMLNSGVAPICIAVVSN